MLTRQEVAERLRISVRGVDRLRATGKLCGVKIGASVRFQESRVSAFEAEAVDAPKVERPAPFVVRDFLGELRRAGSSRPPRVGRRIG